MSSNQTIKSAVFTGSSADSAKCPAPIFPEYAFIGRSNVGKSSLINMLCAKKNLARISNKPGKTKLINHFLINEKWYLVDLPGYGYAGVSKAERAGWAKWFAGYFTIRKNLMCVFVLLDSRLFPQKNDLDFMRWLGEKNVPFSMVFTKADKLSTNELVKNISIYKREMLQWWEELPHIFITSSKNKKGKEELLWFIEETNKLFVSS